MRGIKNKDRSQRVMGVNVCRKIERALVEGNLCEKAYKKIKKITISNILNGKYRRAFFRKIDHFLQTVVLKRMIKKTAIDENKIIFLMFSGDYACNGKGICEEILRQKLPYKLVWGIYKKQLFSDQFPRGVKKVLRQSYDFYHELCTAKVIIDNGISTAHVGYTKKPDQILIQTWHGSLGIKKFSPNTVNDKAWVRKAFKEAEMTDYIISNSDFEDSIYREDYWKTTEIWKFGHARNDILFRPNDWETLRKKISRHYEIPSDSHIFLYAPTFRDDGNMSPYKLDYAELKRTLEERFGGEWVIFVKFHYRVLKEIKKLKLPKETINASDYPDIQELMACADAGMTDYSSWICEYYLTRRPTFIFATDLDDYVDRERELFFPLERLPSSVSYDMQELFSNILSFDEAGYQCRCNQFLADMGSIDDGHASERVVEKLKEIMEGGSK